MSGPVRIHQIGSKICYQKRPLFSRSSTGRISVDTWSWSLNFFVSKCQDREFLRLRVSFTQCTYLHMICPPGRRTRWFRLPILILCAVGLVTSYGCEEEDTWVPRPRKKRGKAKKSAGGTASEDGKAKTATHKFVYNPVGKRDPFRSYLSVMKEEGAPKQERWIFEHRDRLKVPVVVGVGAAFKYHSGLVNRAPRWVRKLGLEWLWRLLSEPRRIWRRVFIDGTHFIWNVSLELTGLKKYE